jgi:hypothetical protein
MFSNLKAMECDNHGFNLHLALYDRPFNNSMNAKATKLSVSMQALFAARSVRQF